MTPERRLVRIQEKGQVTLPAEVRRRFGLKKGDLVAVQETARGILLSPQTDVATGSPERAPRQQVNPLDDLLAWARTGRTPEGIPLRDYTDEELAQFLVDDALNEEERAVARRFGWDEPAP